MVHQTAECKGGHEVPHVRQYGEHAILRTQKLQLSLLIRVFKSCLGKSCKDTVIMHMFVERSYKFDINKFIIKLCNIPT